MRTVGRTIVVRGLPAREVRLAAARRQATIVRPTAAPGAMMGSVKFWVAGFFSGLVLTAGICSGQPPASRPHYVEIKLPPAVISKTFFVRYGLTGEDLGGWVQPLSGVSSYVINTTLDGRPATGIKAILYAPGCAMQTLDLPLSGSTNPQYSFICQPVRSISIAGALIRSDRLYGREVTLHAKYLARWAQAFLGLDESIVTSIPVGDVAYLSADGHFTLVIPDLSQDPLAGAADHPGDLQIWAKDRTSEVIVAQLTPTGPQLIRTRMGGLKVQNEYPSEIVFAPCAANPPQRHDRIGFAIRPDVSDACDR